MSCDIQFLYQIDEQAYNMIDRKKDWNANGVLL